MEPNEWYFHNFYYIQFTKSIRVFELDKECGSEWCIFFSLKQMNSLTNPPPLFPFLLQFLSQVFNFMFFYLICNCHMRSKLFVLFTNKLRKFTCNLLINLLKLISIDNRVDKADTMRETWNLFKNDLKSRKIFELFLQHFMNLLKSSWLNEGKANVDMWWPSFVSRIMLLSNRLNKSNILLGNNS